MPLRHRNPLPSRHEAIAAAVETAGFLGVAELSERFGVSTVTIRGDLDALERTGRLRRVRGGALPLAGQGRETPVESTQARAAAAKARIARRAVDEVASGDTVLLDVGSTTTAIAAELVRRDDLVDVTVFTSSLGVALALEPAIPRLTVVVTGGTLRPLQHSLVEPLATVVLDGITAHLAVIGCGGVHPGSGVTNVNLPETQVKRSMITAARRCVVVADSTKLGEIEVARVCGLDDVDLLVTDDGADPVVLHDLRAAPLTVAVAPGDEV